MGICTEYWRFNESNPFDEVKIQKRRLCRCEHQLGVDPMQLHMLEGQGIYMSDHSFIDRSRIDIRESKASVKNVYRLIGSMLLILFHSFNNSLVSLLLVRDASGNVAYVNNQLHIIV